MIGEWPKRGVYQPTAVEKCNYIRIAINLAMLTIKRAI